MVSALAKESLAKMGFKERRGVLYKEVAELRSDLDNIKDAHLLVQKEIKGIRRAMKLLLASYRGQKADKNTKQDRQLTEQDQMINFPTDYSRDIDMESICNDLPMLEPLSDDDVIFGEYQDDDDVDRKLQVRRSSLQRRQSYHYGSPSPENTFTIRRTSPTRASIQFGTEFGTGSTGFGTNEVSQTPQLASMPEDDQVQSDYMTTGSDTPVSDTTSEERDSFPALRASRQHVRSERARYLKRRSTMDMIDSNSLRWNARGDHGDWESKQHGLESITKDRRNPTRKPPPMLRRGATQPDLYAAQHAPMGSPVNTRKLSSVPPLPLDSRKGTPLQYQAMAGGRGSMSPTSPRSPPSSSPRSSSNSSPRSGLIGSPLTTRRASAAAAAAAALTKHKNPLVRRLTVSADLV